MKQEKKIGNEQFYHGVFLVIFKLVLYNGWLFFLSL